MAVNVAGIIAIALFDAVIWIVGVWSARKQKLIADGERSEMSVVAGRNLHSVIGVFTMTATFVGGGVINGTAESIAVDGLLWTLAPFGIFIGVNIGALVYARIMRNRKYLTMLSPIQELYGKLPTLLLYLASLCGDLFWTASILTALGSSLSVIIELDYLTAVLVSATVTITYTMIGQMISVAYTDAVQLLFMIFGLVLCVPFIMTHDDVGNIGTTKTTWLGSLDKRMILIWADLAIAMTLGSIPWQSYFQRVLSMRSGKESRTISIVAAFGVLVLLVPSILVGGVAVTADWTNTSLGMTPAEANKTAMVFPLVLHEFTPAAVSIIGLGAISAAVMSSVDSSVLGSSSMFTHNVYKDILRPGAKDAELMWIQRIAILIIGGTATLISLLSGTIYGMFIIAADLVFAIILPQLTCALFIPWTNGYGAVIAFFVGCFLRIGAGEPYLNLPPLIKYPIYSSEFGQLFPFRTFAFLCSTVSLLVVSVLIGSLFKKGIIPTRYDVMHCMHSSQYTVNKNGNRERDHTEHRNPAFESENEKTE